jgi:hypothetical protein
VTRPSFEEFSGFRHEPRLRFFRFQDSPLVAVLQAQRALGRADTKRHWEKIKPLSVFKTFFL